MTNALLRTAASAALLTGVFVLAPTAAARSAAPASTIDDPTVTAQGPISPAPAACTVDVTSVHHGVGTGSDDTAAFAAAMRTALATHPHCFAHGPSGKPQAVVSVPAGVYRLVGLHFRSNVRLEVSAAATLQLPPNRPPEGVRMTTPMIEWDTAGAGATPLHNVSLVGVGSATSPAKAAAARQGGAAVAPFELADYFTMNLDPETTGSTNYDPGVELVNVRRFRIENVFSIQNGTNQPAGHIFAWPTSARAVFTIHARKDSPRSGPYIQPARGLIRNHVNVDAPRGFGPNQVGAATRVDFENIYSYGGTALRVETDGSLGPGGVQDRGATVDRVRGTNIIGMNCNRAVSLSPHAQRNGTVRVDDVWAYSCRQGVIAQEDTKVPARLRGDFAKAVVHGVRVAAGPSAQLDSTSMLWTVGRSERPYYIDPAADWNPRIQVVAQAGRFTASS